MLLLLALTSSIIAKANEGDNPSHAAQAPQPSGPTKHETSVMQDIEQIKTWVRELCPMPEKLEIDLLSVRSSLYPPYTEISVLWTTKDSPTVRRLPMSVGSIKRDDLLQVCLANEFLFSFLFPFLNSFPFLPSFSR